MAHCWYKTNIDSTGLINQNFTLPFIQQMDDGTYNAKRYNTNEVADILSQKTIGLLNGLSMPAMAVGLVHTVANAPVPDELIMVLDDIEFAPGSIRNWSFYIALTDTPFTLNWYRLDNNEDPTVLANIQTGRGGAKFKTWPSSRGTIIDSCTVTNKDIIIMNGSVPAKADATFTSDAWIMEIATFGQEKTFAEQVEILGYHNMIQSR